MNKKIALCTLLTFCNMHAASDEEFAKAMLASVFGLRTPSIERRLQALEDFGIVLPIAVDAAIKKTTESAEIIRRLQVENAEFRTQQTRTDIRLDELERLTKGTRTDLDEISMRHATRMDQSEKALTHWAQNLSARIDTLSALIQAQKEHFQSQIETQKEHVQSQIIST